VREQKTDSKKTARDFPAAFRIRRVISKIPPPGADSKRIEKAKRILLRRALATGFSRTYIVGRTGCKMFFVAFRTPLGARL